MSSQPNIAINVSTQQQYKSNKQLPISEQEQLEISRSGSYQYQYQQQMNQCCELLINNLDFSSRYLLVSTNKGMIKYSLKYKSLMKSERYLQYDNIWQSVFIPSSNYFIYILKQSKKSPFSRQWCYIYNYKQQKVSSKFKLNQNIQQLKATKGCIILISLNNIYVLHFPTLKPIYNGTAGNGLRVIYDVSEEGLTIVYDTNKKGEIIIRNFTNVKVNQIITDRKKSIISSKVDNLFEKKYTQEFNDSIKSQVKHIIKVKAHKQILAFIKVSPNGSKVVTASNKGTVLRIFSTKNGQKLQQFRVGYQFTKIMDIKFIPAGNLLGCLTIKGQLHLYHVSMDNQQKKIQKQKRGHNIYTQQNPKSIFSIFSFIFPHLNDSYHFNYYQLENPQINKKVKQNLIKKQGNQINKSQKNKQISINSNMGINEQIAKKNTFLQSSKSIIQELDEQHHENLNNSNSDLVSQKQIIKDQQKKQKLFSNFQQSPPVYDYKSRNRYNKSLQIPQHKKKTQIKRSLSNQQVLNNFTSYTKSYSRLSYQDKINKLRKTTKINQDTKQYKKVSYNFVNKMFITDRNYIWVVKGFYLFGLKYDPFHGGEMVLDKTFKIQ